MEIDSVSGPEFRDSGLYNNHKSSELLSGGQCKQCLRSPARQGTGLTGGRAQCGMKSIKRALCMEFKVVYLLWFSIIDVSCSSPKPELVEGFSV